MQVPKDTTLVSDLQKCHGYIIMLKQRKHKLE